MKIQNARKAIQKQKSKLILKASKTGLYENFGDIEVRVLENLLNPDPYGTTEERQISAMIQEFENWAMDYTG